MTKARLAATVVAAVVALALVATASAAYTSAALSVSYAPGGVTRIVASSKATDDATARAAIVIPNGTRIDTSAAPGTKVGTVKAQVSALALGGALLPLAGDIVVAAPGTIPAAAQTACIGALPVTTSYLLVLQAAGQTINLPAYVTPAEATLGAFGSSQLVFCLSPPDVPVEKGGATFGAKFLSADMTFTGVFSPLATAAWVAVWTPWMPLLGVVNPAGSVSSVDLVLPGLATIKGARVAGRVSLSGQVTQGGYVSDFRVGLWGGTSRTSLRLMKTFVTNDDGRYRVTLGKNAKQKFFQIRSRDDEVVNTGSDAKAMCKDAGVTLPAPCSSFAISGFETKSRIVAVK
jgi:hypothetical protein